MTSAPEAPESAKMFQKVSRTFSGLFFKRIKIRATVFRIEGAAAVSYIYVCVSSQVGLRPAGTFTATAPEQKLYSKSYYYIYATFERSHALRHGQVIPMDASLAGSHRFVFGA